MVTTRDCIHHILKRMILPSPLEILVLIAAVFHYSDLDNNTPSTVVPKLLTFYPIMSVCFAYTWLSAVY